MPRFNRARDLQAHLEKALGELQKETVVTAQARLGSTALSPRDSGRLRSSWFASAGDASTAVAPEGADAPQTDAEALTIDWRREYHLINNLPYTLPIALGVNLPPSWGGVHRVVSAPRDWFIRFRDIELPTQIQPEAAATTKRRFEL